MESTLFTLLFALTLFFVLTQLVLFIAFMRAMKDFQKSHNPDEESLKRTKSRSSEILQEAMKKANDILARAEKQGVDILAGEEKTGKSLTEDYRRHLNEVEKLLEESLNKSLHAADESYREFADDVGKRVGEHLKANEAILQDKAGQVITKSQEVLTEVTRSVQESVKKQVDAELASVRDDVAEYKRQRMRIIDERIIEMLEDVIKVTLEKKLSLVEQSELVYKALEEAKRENAFT